MQLIPSDLVTDLHGASAGLSGFGLGLGLCVWVSGWRRHRFWIVLLTTVGAGLVGLLHGPGRLQPVMAGLLLAITAGVLALSLVRIVAFLAGGAALWLIIHQHVPPPWNEPLISVLAGGLGALLLFRLWVMALTSFAGAWLTTLFGLCLADRLGRLDAVAWTEQRGPLVNAICGGTAVGGVLLQVFLAKRRARLDRERKEKEQLDKTLRRMSEPKSWFGRGRQYRRTA